MKLQFLPMGARFEYQGTIYVKTGPMMAASETGEQKLIPRYAMLTPLDPMPSPTAPANVHQIPEPVVLAAFEKFYQSCSRLVEESGRLELARARLAFLEALKGGR